MILLHLAVIFHDPRSVLKTSYNLILKCTRTKHKVRAFIFISFSKTKKYFNAIICLNLDFVLFFCAIILKLFGHFQRLSLKLKIQCV